MNGYAMVVSVVALVAFVILLYPVADGMRVFLGRLGDAMRADAGQTRPQTRPSSPDRGRSTP